MASAFIFPWHGARRGRLQRRKAHPHRARQTLPPKAARRPPQPDAFAGLLRSEARCLPPPAPRRGCRQRAAPWEALPNARHTFPSSAETAAARFPTIRQGLPVSKRAFLRLQPTRAGVKENTPPRLSPCRAKAASPPRHPSGFSSCFAAAAPRLLTPQGVSPHPPTSLPKEVSSELFRAPCGASGKVGGGGEREGGGGCCCCSKVASALL